MGCENCGKDVPTSTISHSPSSREADVCQKCIQEEKLHLVSRILNGEIGRSKYQ